MMLTPEEVLFVVKDCGARTLLASPEKGMALLDNEDASLLEEIILCGDDTPPGVCSFNELLRCGAPEFESVNLASDSLSTICYTSGTTGHPKGAMQTHGSVLIN